MVSFLDIGFGFILPTRHGETHGQKIRGGRGYLVGEIKVFNLHDVAVQGECRICALLKGDSVSGQLEHDRVLRERLLGNR